MRRQIFDLDKGPPFRLTLIRLAAAEHILLVTMHHIIADQWSMRLFRNELAAFYKAFAQGEPAAVAALPYQFADFSRWQRQMFDTGGFDDQVELLAQAAGRSVAEDRFSLRSANGAKKLTLRTGRLIDGYDSGGQRGNSRIGAAAENHTVRRCWLRR